MPVSATTARTARSGYRVSRRSLERLYRFYDRLDMVHPDPLEFLYRYDDPAEREIVGLVASALAFGNVAHILRSAEEILGRMGPPMKFLCDASPCEMIRTFSGFRHRMTTGENMAALLSGARRVIKRYGSLRDCFLSNLKRDHADVMPALVGFVAELDSAARGQCGNLLADPTRGSACKRLHLLLRWLVRHDNVDPGGWEAVGQHRLLVPIDTHMLRLCRALRLTRRRQADLRTAREITLAFRRFSPDDPVKYDFALSRIGIRKDTELSHFFARSRYAEANEG